MLLCKIIVYNMQLFLCWLYMQFMISYYSALKAGGSLWEQMFAEFLCKKVYKNNCLNCLKIYVRIFIQCININCRNFQIIQKTLVVYRFNSLNFSELKWKSVKRVFFIFRRYIYRRDVEKILKIFFIFCENVLNFDFEKF